MGFSMPTFAYRTVELGSRAKKAERLPSTDLLKPMVQIVGDGGETNLHSHHGQDAIWFVLSGRARFYDEQDDSVECGKWSGVVIPRGAPYWFEAVGDEPLEVLHVVAIDPRVEDRRVNLSPLTSSTLDLARELGDDVGA